MITSSRWVGPLVLGLVLLLPTQSQAAFIGSVSAPDGSGVDTTGGAWLNNPAVGLSWNISQNMDGSWHYSYTHTTPSQGDLSHLIIELSTSITGITTTASQNSIFNLAVAGATSTAAVIGTFSGANPSNPGMPGTIYGLKLDPTGQTSSITFSFDVFRAPTWGDFYSKDGNAGGGTNAAWNTGFISGETAGFNVVGSNDPLVAAANGPHVSGGLYHILVPDTNGGGGFGDPVPEPASMALFGAGGVWAGLGLFLRRRKTAAA